MLLGGVATVCASLAPVVFAHVKPADVTYTRDVAPILEKRCAGCHAPGGATPALDSYEQARRWARGIKEEVLQHRMPPWSAASGLGDYGNDPRPTPIEIDILTAWADGGTPRGAIDTRAGTIVPAADRRAAGVVRFARAHPARGAIEQVRARFDSDRMWLSGWEYRPGDVRAITQVVFFADGARIGSWVPSDSVVTYPRGVALAVRHGATITAEFHLRKASGTGIDAGTLLLYSGRAGVEPRYRAFACGTTLLQQDVKALTVTPSASEAGAFVEVVARRPDQSVEPMAAVMRYLPAYPATYRFRTPVTLPRGTAIDVRSSAPGCMAGIDFIAMRPARAASPRP